MRTVILIQYVKGKYIFWQHNSIHNENIHVKQLDFNNTYLMGDIQIYDKKPQIFPEIKVVN